MNTETKEIVDKDSRGYLLITVAEITSAEKNKYNLPEGAYVRSVIEGGASEQAGMKQGAIISSINNKTINTTQDIQQILQYFKVGDKVEVTVKRFNQEKNSYEDIKLTITLSSNS